MFKSLLMVLFLLINSSNYYINNDLTFKINTKIAGYSIVSNHADNKNNLIISYISNNERKYYRYNNKGEVIHEDAMRGGYVGILQNKIFYWDKEFYSIDLNNSKKIVYHGMRDNQYKGVDLCNYNNGEILVTYNSWNIYVYDVNSSKIICDINKSITNEEGAKFERVKYQNGYLIYTYKNNGIAVFSIKSNKLLWKYDTGSLPVKVLGIKFGSLPNFVSDFEIESKRNVLVVNCGLGSIYKFDLMTGKMIQKVDNFRGVSSNAGVMNYIDLIDMNNDGVPDIIGGSVDHNIYCLNGKNLALIWKFDTDNEIQLPLTFYDINNDNVPEVFCVNDYDNNLYVLDGKTGKQLVKRNVKDNNNKKLNQTSVILADYNGNGLLDILLRVNPHTIQLFEMADVKVPKNSIAAFPNF